MKRWFHGLTVASLLVAGLPAGHSLAQEKLRVVFPTPPTTFALPFYIAKDLGRLNELGIEAEEIYVAGDANATRVLASGGAEVGVLGPLNVLSALENGARIKVIGAWQPVVEYQVVAPPAIASMKDLVGKTFATSGPSGLPQVLPTMLFNKLGLDAGGMKFVAVGGHSARLQAVVAGKADAAIVNLITAAEGIRTGKVHVVVSVDDYFSKLGYIYLGVRTDDLQNPVRRKAFEGFMRASIEGARTIVREPEKSIDVMHARLKDTDRALLASVIKELTARHMWGTDGGIDPEVTTFTARLHKDLGDVQTLFTPEQVIDRSIVDRVLADLGKS